jgi:AcrR family transcriptional regulator
MSAQPADGPVDAVGDDAYVRLAVAAIKQFSVHGFHGTTTRDIARAAGMSPAALYIHHRSKEELLYAISLYGHRLALDIVQAAAGNSSDPAGQLAEVMRAFAAHQAREHTSARVVNYELAALSPEHLHEINALRRTIEDLVCGIVEAGVASGQFHTPDPRLTSAALLSLCIDITRWYRDGRRWSPEEVAGHYCELALRMVSADPARGRRGATTAPSPSGPAGPATDGGAW